MEDIDYVSHQAALGSVPRSINDPATSNDVNISGFLNMLIVTRIILKGERLSTLYTQVI